MASNHAKRIENLIKVLMSNYAAQDLDNKPQNLAALAKDSLNILSALLDEAPICSDIAKSLSLIFRPQENHLQEDLREDFLNVDASLEDDLRGFAALFDEVTKDCEISRDFVFDLASIDRKYHGLGQIFEKMALAIDSYLTLHEGFELDSPKACAVLFLLYLEQVSVEISSNKREIALINFKLWLDGWFKDPDIHRLFQYFAPLNGGYSWDLHEPVISSEDRESLIIVLCQIMAHECKLSSAEIARLDQAIKRQKMPGIEPLIRSGLIWSDSTEQFEPPLPANIAKLFPVV